MSGGLTNDYQVIRNSVCFCFTPNARLTGLLLKTIAVDLHFFIMEDEGFRTFVSSLDPSFIILPDTCCPWGVLTAKYH